MRSYHQICVVTKKDSVHILCMTYHPKICCFSRRIGESGNHCHHSQAIPSLDDSFRRKGKRSTPLGRIIRVWKRGRRALERIRAVSRAKTSNKVKASAKKTFKIHLALSIIVGVGQQQAPSSLSFSRLPFPPSYFPPSFKRCHFFFPLCSKVQTPHIPYRHRTL